MYRPRTVDYEGHPGNHLATLIMCVSALAGPAAAQEFRFGLKAGVPLSTYFETGRVEVRGGFLEHSAATRRYTLGPSTEWCPAPRVALELDVLYAHRLCPNREHFRIGRHRQFVLRPQGPLVRFPVDGEIPVARARCAVRGGGFRLASHQYGTRARRSYGANRSVGSAPTQSGQITCELDRTTYILATILE
jgi:hypothetical protein